MVYKYRQFVDPAECTSIVDKCYEEGASVLSFALLGPSQPCIPSSSVSLSYSDSSEPLSGRLTCLHEIAGSAAALMHVSTNSP